MPYLVVRQHSGSSAAWPSCRWRFWYLAGDSAIDAGIFGEIAAALAFLLTGLGMHMTQTAGLALAADRATEADPRKSRLNALRHVSCGHGDFSGHHWHIVA